MEESAFMLHVSSNLSETSKTDGKPAVHADDAESALLKRYLRDVRRFALLSHEHERALAKQIQESRGEWQRLLLDHLLHVPLLLAWWPRIRRGALPMTTLCRPGSIPPATELKVTLQGLHGLHCQMREAAKQRGASLVQTVPALRATMRALLHDWDWQLEFLQQAWQRFDTTMSTSTAASAQPCRQATCYA